MTPDPNCPLCKAVADPGRAWGTNLVWRFPHSFAHLGPWQFYTGYCVLVSRQHATELSQLGPTRAAFLDEMATLAAAIEATFRPHKLNYELLGNQVPHLHWHLFPRPAEDPDALKPVWLALERAEHDPQERRRLQTGPQGRVETTAALRNTLRSLFTSSS